MLGRYLDEQSQEFERSCKTKEYTKELKKAAKAQVALNKKNKTMKKKPKWKEMYAILLDERWTTKKQDWTQEFYALHMPPTGSTKPSKRHEEVGCISNV